MSLWELFLTAFVLMSCFAVDVVIVMASYYWIRERVSGRGGPDEQNA